jgi:hypothetical protein
MAKTIENAPRAYVVVIKDPDGNIMHEKLIPEKMVDSVNLTKHHKLKAIMNLVAK